MELQLAKCLTPVNHCETYISNSKVNKQYIYGIKYPLPRATRQRWRSHGFETTIQNKKKRSETLNTGFQSGTIHLSCQMFDLSGRSGEGITKICLLLNASIRFPVLALETMSFSIEYLGRFSFSPGSEHGVVAQTVVWPANVPCANNGALATPHLRCSWKIRNVTLKTKEAWIHSIDTRARTRFVKRTSLPLRFRILRVLVAKGPLGGRRLMLLAT